MSAQVAAANAQQEELQRQQAELKASQEAEAQKNTESLKGIRRRQSGRALLINTGEQGLTEANNLGT
jgi:hypothetical protein